MLWFCRRLIHTWRVPRARSIAMLRISSWISPNLASVDLHPGENCNCPGIYYSNCINCMVMLVTLHTLIAVLVHIALLLKFWRSTVYSVVQARISSAICKGLTIIYFVYYLLRPHMIINCVNVVIILFCLGVKIIFTRFHFLTNVCLV